MFCHPDKGGDKEDFQELIEFLKESKFERVGAFIYSHEEGTPSYDLPNQVPEDVKQRRFDELMYTQRAIAHEHNQALVGREVDVLIERVSEENDYVMVGRIAQQAPEIDGVCYVGYREGMKLGQIVRGVVEQVTDYDLAVTPLDEAQSTIGATL